MRLYACVLLLLLMAPAVASEQVQVGLYLLNLGRFDVATGAFTADFYLSMKCAQNCSDSFEFMNGRATSTDKLIDLPGEKFYRIQAGLSSQIDLKQFPFDSQTLEIVLEDKLRTSEEITYVPVPEESGIDPSIAFTGWNIDGWHAEAREHDYPVFNETFSQYAFKVNISRIFLNSILKTFLPVFFILLVVIFSFVLDPDKITTRLTMAGSSLVASVMFHVSISNQIPPVGYLTFADKFMALTYFVLFVSFVINILLLEFQERKQPELVEKIHRATEYAMFAFVPLVYGALFLFAL